MIKLLLLRLLLPTLFASLVLCGCSTLNNYDNVALTKMHQELIKKESFRVNGKLGIFAKERLSTYLNIDVLKDNYTIYLSDITGSTIFKLENFANNVTITDHTGNIYHGTNPDELVTKLTGLSIPTAALPFILKAIPLDYPHTLEHGLLKTMQYKDMNITYESYDIIDNIPVPTLIMVYGKDFKLKISITKWDFSSNK